MKSPKERDITPPLRGITKMLTNNRGALFQPTLNSSVPVYPDITLLKKNTWW